MSVSVEYRRRGQAVWLDTISNKLIETGKLSGRRLASWSSLQTDIENAGAQWVDQEAVVDGNLVTSRKPDDIPAFNREMIALIGRTRAGQATAQ